MTETPEQILLRQIGKGDSRATKKLYDLYSGYLFSICSRYVSSREDAKDLLQESFIKILSSIQQFKYLGKGSLKAWMSKITVNEALKHLRKTAKTSFIIYGDNEPGIADIADSDTPPDLEDIPASAVLDMVRRLPVGYRTIFNLYVFEQKSHKEIADLLKIKESTSASQLHRAKALLCKWVEEYRKNNLDYDE